MRNMKKIWSIGMRWDLVGILGVFIGAAGVGLTYYIHEQEQQNEHRIACANQNSVINEAVDAVELSQIRLAEAEEVFETRVQDAEVKAAYFNRARQYFEALEGEILADKVRNQFARAKSSDLDWHEALEASGYPTDLSERRLIARKLWNFGIEHGFDNALVLGGMGRTVEALVEELERVSRNAAVQRDENFRQEFQGVLNQEAFLQDIRNARERALNDRHSAEQELRESRSKLSQAEVALSGAESRFDELGCSI